MNIKSRSARAVITPPRGRGRPRVIEPMSSVSTRLPTSTHDRLIAVANQQETSVSELVRQVLIQNLLIVNVFQLKR